MSDVTADLATLRELLDVLEANNLVPSAVRERLALGRVEAELARQVGRARFAEARVAELEAERDEWEKRYDDLLAAGGGVWPG